MLGITPYVVGDESGSFRELVGVRMASGACNCGAISFEVSGDITDVYVCHCSICRRLTGSNGIAVVVVSKERFRWTGGEEHIKSWKKPGHNWQTWFCGTCGSTLPGINDTSRIFIPAGLISEGDGQLRVAHHIWVNSRAPWDVIGDAGRQHSDAYTAD